MIFASHPLQSFQLTVNEFNIDHALIESFLKVDPTLVKPIKLNSVTVEVLKSHPYLNWNKANSIIKIRDKKGGYKSILEIKESVLIDEECFENLKPYLSL